MPSDNTPLTGAMLTQICHHMASLDHNGTTGVERLPGPNLKQIFSHYTHSLLLIKLYCTQ